MAGKKVLIAFASSFGYVTEISYEISKILTENGFYPYLLDLKSVKQTDWPNVNDFDGILIGCSPKYSGFLENWSTPTSAPFVRKELKNFLTQNIPIIINTKKILGLFRNDPFIFYPILNPEPTSVDFEKVVMEKLGFKPSICTHFGPVLDFSSSSKLKREPRNYLRRLAKQFSKKTGIAFNMKGYNDFRDWNNIHEFTIRFAKMVDNTFNPTEIR